MASWHKGVYSHKRDIGAWWSGLQGMSLLDTFYWGGGEGRKEDIQG